MAAAVSGLSPVIITVRMPILRSSVEALPDPALDDVLQVDHAEHAARSRDDQRRAAGAARCARRMRFELRRYDAVRCPRRNATTASTAPLRMVRAVQVDSAHPGLRRERHEVAAELVRRSRPRRP